MFNKIRYLMSVWNNSFSYLNAFNDNLLDYYLGHHKIIGWYKGMPAYSTFLNPGLSKPLGNTLSRRLLSNILQKPLPGIANIGVTDKCNAKCQHCSFYNAMDKNTGELLEVNQIKNIIKSCQDFGVSIINIVGGEPLLRKEIIEIIESIDKDKSSCSLFTNGWKLEELASKLKKAGLMMVNVSLDSTDEKTHDEYRKLPGLYKRAIKGIKKCKKIGLLTSISTTITKEDIENGSVEKMIKYAKRLGVNEVLILDALSVGMYSHRKEKSLDKVALDKLNRIVAKYNKDKSYPGIFSYPRFRSIYGCSAGRNYFYIGPYGDLYPCDFNSKPIGNLLKEDLSAIWFRLSNLRNNDSIMNECCKIAK